MKPLIALVALALIFVLFSCGGGTVNPESEQDPPVATSPSDGPPPGAEAAPSPGEAQQGPEAADPEGQLITGVKYDALRSLAGGTLELPPLPGGLPDQSDSALPQVLLVSVAEGKTVHGSVHITATGIDDTGVNYSALLVDDVLVSANESQTLEHIWRTYGLADGEHLLQFVVRDNGDNVGVCAVHVSVDNSRDWGPPEIDLDSIACAYGAFSYSPEREQSWGHKDWNITGRADLVLKAYDGSGIRRFAAYRRLHPSDEHLSDCDELEIDWSNCTLLGESSTGELELTVNAATWGKRDYILAFAEDTRGETSYFCFGLEPRTRVNVYAVFRDLAGDYPVGIELYRMPEGWVPTEDPDLSLAVDVSVSDERYRCYFRDLPMGNYHFVAAYKGQIIVYPFEALPIRNWMQWPELNHIVQLDH